MSNTRFEVLNLIRDARGLNYKEKVFLFVVETRNEMYARWDTNATDMGLSKDVYFRTRTAVIEKELVKEVRRMNDTTIFTINVEGLQAWVDSHIANEDSQIENEHSHIENSHSHIKESKVTLEGNSSKVTHEDNHGAVAPVVREDDVEEATSNEVEGSASPLPIEDDSFKDEQVLLTASDLSPEPSPNWGPKVPRESTPHSHIENGWSKDKEKQVRQYLKSKGQSSKAFKIMIELKAGSYPDLTGEAWCRHALNEMGVSDTLIDAQW